MLGCEQFYLSVYFFVVAWKVELKYFSYYYFLKIITTNIILITQKNCVMYTFLKNNFRESVGTVSLSRRLENLSNISVRNVCGINP